MEIGTPFIVDNSDREFENHIENSSDIANAEKTNSPFGESLPFEFSRTRMWNESLYSPEIGGGHSIAVLEKELGEIKTLITDIKDILKAQVSSSVLWEDSIRKMISDGVDTFVQIDCAEAIAAAVILACA